jgi:hypothetical protein
VTKRKHLSLGKFLILINLSWFAIVAVLLFAIQWQQERLISKVETIRFLAKEINWQRFTADKAKAQVVNLPELQFLAQVLETKDRDFYAVTKAAWKYGNVYHISPFLILAVAHRETSGFDRFTISYNKDGSPCAYGIMQINAAVWHPDMDKIFEIEYNVELGTKILKTYLDKNPGDIGAGLFAYWGGKLAGGRYTYPPLVLESKFFNLSPIGMVQ